MDLPPSIHQDLARDEARLVGGEEHGGAGEVLGDR